MVDIARLGLEVDSRQVKTANRDLDDLSRKAKGAEQAAGGLKNASGGLAGSFVGTSLAARQLAGGLGIGVGLAAWLSVVGGIAAIVASVPAAISALQRFEEQMFVLEAVLKATNSASGQTVASIEKIADSIGGISQVREAAAMLLTFRSVSEDVFARALQAADDLAAVGFGNIQQSALMLGKALEDPITGLTALRRVGVTFSETQREVIQNFMRMGNVAKAQQEILRGVEMQVGGAGAAKDRGLAGSFEALADAQQRLFETWSKFSGIAPGLKSVLDAWTGFIKALTPETDPAVKLAATLERIAALQQTMSKMPMGPDAAFDRGAAQQQLEALQAQSDLLRREIEHAEKAAATARQLAKEAQEGQKQEALAAAGRMLLEQEAKRLGLLGELAGITGQVRQKEIELTQANEQSAVVNERQAKAILDLVQLRGELARTEARISMGVATNAEIEAQAYRRVTDALVTKTIEGGEELRKFTTLQLRDAEATRIRLAVLNSLTPSLTRLSLESQNLTSLLDRELAGALGGVSTTLLEMAKGSKSAAQGLSEMAMAMLDAIAKALIMRAVVGPLAGFLGGGLSAAGGLLGPTAAAAAGPSLAATEALRVPALGTLQSSIRAPASASAGASVRTGDVKVIVNNAPAGVRHQETRRTPGGSVELELWLADRIEGTVMSDLERGGPISRAQETAYGVRRRLGG